MKKIIIYLKLLLIILIPIFSWFCLEKILINNNKKFDELALGQDNFFLNDKLLDNKILCNSLDNVSECILYLKKHKTKILWIGNSQLHAVNQPDINAKLSSYIVSENLQKKEIGLVTFAAPNINFQEYLSVLIYFTKEVDLDYIILSLCFDDTREDNVRKNLVNNEEKITNSLEKKITIEDNVRKNLVNNEEKITNSLEKKITISLEKRITNYLEKKIQWNSIRQQAQGHTFDILYRLRNYIFNIEPSSTRRIIKPLYYKNINALEKTLEISKSKKIQSIMYITPIRHDVKMPYDTKEYNLFKTHVSNLSKRYNSNFYNLEKIIPNSFWGEKPSTTLNNIKEIDFMHFKQEWHIALAKHIIQILSQYF